MHDLFSLGRYIQILQKGKVFINTKNEIILGFFSAFGFAPARKLQNIRKNPYKGMKTMLV